MHRPDPAPDGVHAEVGGAPAAALWLWRTHNAVNARLNRSNEADVLKLGLRKVSVGVSVAGAAQGKCRGQCS